MILHRPLDLTTIPDEVTARAGSEQSRFSASWRSTQHDLQAEANHLAGRHAPQRGGVDVYVEVDLPPSAIRNDGGIRSNARPPTSHVVAVTVPHRELGELRLVSGRYKGSGSYDYLPGWQANVRAVALTLKAMRDMERWGAATGQQYRGFAAIGATSSGTALGTGLTPADAAAVLWRVADLGLPPDLSRITAEDVSGAYRGAARRCHPDTGSAPDGALFTAVTEARDLLTKGLRRG